jgi:hypothetical protein
MLIGVVRLENDLLVRSEPKPLKPLKDRLRRFLGRACEVGVLNAKQEFSAGVPGVQIVKQRRARRSDVKITRRRRGETNSNSNN